MNGYHFAVEDTLAVPAADAGLTAAMIGVRPLAADDPQRISDIPIRGVLGSGGMGQVYLGLTPHGYAAVKRMRPELADDPTFVVRFGQELANQAGLPSGVSARLLASNVTARPPWFAAEYIPGATLAEAVQLSGGRLPADTVWALLRDMAAHLRVLRRLDLVHRDLKPSNIMLTDGGLTLIDFGVARAVDQSLQTTTGKIVGTPAFMAPEQVAGARPLTPAADVFALGSVLCFAATGAMPFGGGPIEVVLYRISRGEPDLDALRDLDPALAELAGACLAKDPQARPGPAALAEAAAARAPAGPSAWPGPVAARIAARRAFAQAAPALDLDAGEPRPHPATAGAGPEPGALAGVYADTASAAPAGGGAVVVADPGHVPDLDPPPGARRRRRRRLALMALPLVLVAGGGTLAVTQLPFSRAAPAGASAPPAPATGSSGSATTTTAASASAPAAPSASPRLASPAARQSGATTGAGNPGAAAPGPAPAGSAPAPAAPAAPAAKPKTQPSSGGGGAAGPGNPAVVSATSSLLDNASSGQCLSSSGTPAGLGPAACSSSAAAQGWKAVYSGSTFELVNQADGDCLTGQGSNFVILFPCGGDSGQEWTVGTSTSTGGTIENVAFSGTCLESASGGEMTPACNSADTGQLWRDGGSVG